jgi:hypothetical protein
VRVAGVGAGVVAADGRSGGQRTGQARSRRTVAGGRGWPTLLLSAAYPPPLCSAGLRRRRISPSPAAYPPPLRSARTAMGGAEQHAAAGERSSAGRLSGARGRLVAVGYVSVREFLASLFRDTRTRRGYVSRPYPRRIRVGYVSDTGYAPSLPYPCF